MEPAQICVASGSSERLFVCHAPSVLELQRQVAAVFEGVWASASDIRFVWRHKNGESQICDDASFAKAWQTSRCDRGGSLKLRICENSHQLSSALAPDRTCGRCGQEFSSRNQLMRHVQSLGHYVEGAPKNSGKSEELEAPEKQEGCKAWDLYYQDLPDFSKIRELMRQPLPHCFKRVPASPLSDLALDRVLQLEPRARPVVGLECWALDAEVPSGESVWGLLQAAQDCGALQRQEASSMVPVTLLEVEPHHYVADMCAAPASKTLQLLDVMSAGARPGEVAPGLLVANDDNWSRCASALRRTHQHPQSLPLLWLCGDAREFPTLHDHSAGRVRGARKIRFDRILCDVPCSGDGRLRRSLGAWAAWRPRYMLQMHYVQSAILKRGLAMLKPQGRLLYSTCSMSPVENEAVVAAALEKLGGQIRLLSVEQWRHAPGLTVWRVPLPDGSGSFGSAKEVEAADPKLWCTKGGPLAPTMFPPADQEVAASLRRCVRITPCGDFGGFFCALFEKVTPGPAGRPAPEAKGSEVDARAQESKAARAEVRDALGHGKQARKKAEGAEERKSKEEEEDQDVQRHGQTFNPIPPLLAAAPAAQLEWLMSWFGLIPDAAEAEKLGVRRFPVELLRGDPSLKDGMILGSTPIGRLVLKHARPRVMAAGMPLLADSGADSEHPSRFDVAQEAAHVLAACATRRCERVGWPSFAAMLRGEAVLRELAAGPLIAVLHPDSSPRLVEEQLCLAGRLTSAGMVATASSTHRYSMLRLLSP
ncbi:unnamed protein product [Effrenium voratum]|nr:unnamed protein product [Effrenium voratum]